MTTVTQNMSGTRNVLRTDQTRLLSHHAKGWECSNVSQQIEIYSRFLPKVDFTGANEMASKIELVGDASVIMVFPKLPVVALADGFDILDPYLVGYMELCRKLLCKARPWFRCNPKNFLKDYSFRINLDVLPKLKEFEAADERDFTVCAVDLGDRKTGLTSSPIDSRQQALRVVEEILQLPFGVAYLAMALMVNPRLVVAYKDLFLDASGDEVNWFKAPEEKKENDRYHAYDKRPWASVPCVRFDNCRLELTSRNDSCLSADYSTPVLYYKLAPKEAS